MKDIWGLYLILGMIPAFILFAFIVKYLEVLKARHWSSVQGRIIVSTSESRGVRKGVDDDADTETRNFAKIVYEYTIAGRRYQGSRVSIGEDTGDSEVAETIARYPKGKEVTVYYNPSKRTEAVLEREVPPLVFKGLLIVVGVLVALIVGGVVGVQKLADFMATVVRNPVEAPFVTGLLVFAILTALFVYAFNRSMSLQKAWPVVPGRIESVDVSRFVSHSSDEGRTRETVMYRPKVVYAYEAAGVAYKGESIGGANVSSSSEAYARKCAAKFSKGAAVEVHYNPENPAQSAVNPGLSWAWVLWIIPMLFVAGAYFIAR